MRSEYEYARIELEELIASVEEGVGSARLADAARLAIGALWKQEPMKPTYDHRYAEMGCADCGNLVGGWEETPNYCPNCGQRIDWVED